MGRKDGGGGSEERAYMSRVEGHKEVAEGDAGREDGKRL